MNEQGMKALAPTSPELTSRAFHFGSFSPWLISLPAKLGRMGKVISWGLNFVAHLQPVDVKVLCPLVVLEVRRAPDPASGQKHGRGR